MATFIVYRAVKEVPRLIHSPNGGWLIRVRRALEMASSLDTAAQRSLRLIEKCSSSMSNMKILEIRWKNV